MTEKSETNRRGLIRKLARLLAGVVGDDLNIVWRLVLAMRRNHPRDSGQKKLLPSVLIPTRCWYSVRWIVPMVIGVDD